ncbi:hypothetical protein AB0945_23435 [Streptomyces sp. NPDC005474]|uniref:hypothetical protein n=1 Tax=Streptomyces sp. NPDC005474 TaxID=3154878 RepID=UPI0034518FC4
MSTGKIRAAAQQTEDTMLRAYRLWFEHARKCDTCKHVTSTRDGCKDGQELWGTYRLAQIGYSEEKGQPS